MTAARRAAAFLAEIGGPVVWLFALLGAGLAAFAGDWWDPYPMTDPRPSGGGDGRRVGSSLPGGDAARAGGRPAPTRFIRGRWS